MNSNSFVVVEDSGPVRWLILNQPARRNAVPFHGWDELTEALTEFAISRQRVVVLRGAGEDFCSGADLDFGELEGLRSPAIGKRHMKVAGRTVTALHGLAKPSIAAVDGVAVGGGMNLALGCDLVVATNRSRFGEVFVKRGLTVDLGGTWLLPRIIGMARARELAMTGRMVDAAEALEMAMVCRMVTPGDLRPSVQRLGEELAAGAPLAQQFIKKGLARSLDMTFEQALAYEEQAQAALLASDDVREGVTAFLEGREAHFEGR